MSRREFIDWIAFHRQWPFDDAHRYHRPAALIATKIAGGDVQQLLDWLQPPEVPEEMSDVDLSVLRAFGIKHFGE